MPYLTVYLILADANRNQWWQVHRISCSAQKRIGAIDWHNGEKITLNTIIVSQRIDLPSTTITQKMERKNSAENKNKKCSRCRSTHEVYMRKPMKRKIALEIF